MQHDTLPQFIFSNRYARYSPEKQRRLTWEESVKQMMDMHRRKATSLNADQLQPVIDAIEEGIFEGLLLGSQRALQYGGLPMERHNEKGYNCTFSLCDRPKFFSEGLYLLLCGCGVGFSVQKQHVDQLPTVVGARGSEPYVVQDSIEGWADAAQALMDAHFFGLPAPEFDYSLVRPRGSPISTGVGKAPGPEALAKALEKVRLILQREAGYQLRPIDAYDIFMHLADSVVSGGVRRSATLALCSIDDLEMINAKVGDWYEENPQRARSNNSVVALRSTITKEQLRYILAPSQEEMGDLGLYLTSDTDSGINPCAEIWFKPILELSENHHATGWSFCNLCEINATKVETLADGLRAAYLASVLGTLQATYTEFPYLGPVSEAIAVRDSLLGVSITGIMDNPDILNEFTLQVMARQVVSTNEIVAKMLGIPAAARSCCIKPSGKASLIFSVSAGCHRRKGHRTLRRVQATSLEAPAEFLMKRSLMHEGNSLDGLVEPGSWGTDYCFSFPERAPEGALIEPDATAVDQLKSVKFLKDFWVNPGHTEGDETHNVSNTLFVEPGEWEDVLDYVWDNIDSFNSLSFQRASSSLEWPQAPTVPVDTFDELVADFGPLWVDIAIGRWYDRPVGQTVWEFKLANASAKNVTLEELHHRVALYCVYETLTKSGFAIDFTELVEDEDNTQLAAMAACVGGSCEI